MTVEIPDDRKVHSTSVRVRFYELDPYDHVNHTNYFAYFETARIEYLTDLGWGLVPLKEQDLQFVVVTITAKFHAAARYGEELTIHTWIEKAGRVRSTWHQVILRQGEVIASMMLEAAVTDLDGRPRRLPAEFVGQVMPSGS